MLFLLKGYGVLNGYISLDRIKPDEWGEVVKLNAVGSMRKRLMDIGLLEGTKIKCVGESPLGDPKAYLIRGAVIAIRNSDGKNIILDRRDGGAD